MTVRKNFVILGIAIACSPESCRVWLKQNNHTHPANCKHNVAVIISNNSWHCTPRKFPLTKNSLQSFCKIQPSSGSNSIFDNNEKANLDDSFSTCSFIKLQTIQIMWTLF